uniref:Uncharacterized protein MANES_05G189500 n=1 Tax=Rhizophora mucronata TaxID=61149 RepID=A0A2P2KQU2_RHIMU
MVLRHVHGRILLSILFHVVHGISILVLAATVVFVDLYRRPRVALVRTRLQWLWIRCRHSRRFLTSPTVMNKPKILKTQSFSATCFIEQKKGDTLLTSFLFIYFYLILFLCSLS